jgi:hypothetical protein
MKNKFGQVTIFIIIAVIIVAVVVLFLVLRKNTVSVQKIPATLEQPYVVFLSCLQDDSEAGISILESQGGYINLPNFEPGSSYMPFSSQLNFLGINIPYWYYVSGNNVQKEQVPTKADMETQLSNFINKKIKNCDLKDYYNQGFEIQQGEPKASVSIVNGEVYVDLAMDLTLVKANENTLIKNHKIVVKSQLGNLYDSAKIVYQKEQKELFLENYGIDDLRLYAPVDGVQMTCGPLTWDADNIFNKLQEGIEANTLALKSIGTKGDYFFVDTGVTQGVRFINSKNWSNNFDVSPGDGRILIASPVGNQPGLGILGFCYVPYHFVYNVGYPVLVQVYEGNEIFQFPVAVVIRGNKAREPLSSSATDLGIPDFCKYKNTLTDVLTYDIRTNPVNAEISYECSGTTCYIGSTDNGKLKTEFPQCVNGKVVARASGYDDSETQYSTNAEGQVDLVLNKIYPINLALKLDGRVYSGSAIVSFVSNTSSKSIYYPDQKAVELSQGQYDVQVYIYSNSSLKIEPTTAQQCVEVPQSGIGGLVGLTEKKCFDVNMPEQIVSSALSGGGKAKLFVLESNLASSKVLEINSESLPKPTSLEQLQTNYILFDDKTLEINFK